MSKAYLVQFVWPKPYFLPDLGAARGQHTHDPQGGGGWLCGLGAPG